jgi:Flp pilus assembly protein CpaB
MATAEAVLPRAHSRLRRIDLRVAVGLLLMLVAVVGGAGLIKSAQARIPVLIAAGSLEPGEVITAADLRVAEMSLAGGVAHLPAAMESSLVGRVATEPWWEGKLLGPGSVADAPPLPAGSVAMSLMLKPDRAAGGGLRAGDHVAVIASQAPGREEARTTILLPSVAVLSVSQAPAEEGGGVLVTLRLRLEEARLVAQARTSGEIDLVLLSRASS